MEMHGRLGRSRRAGREGEQRHIVASGAHGLECLRLCQRGAIEFGVMRGAAVELHDALQRAARRRRRLDVLGEPTVGQGKRNLRLVDDLREFAGAQHRHRVDDDGARLVAASQAATKAGLLPERTSTRLPGLTP